MLGQVLSHLRIHAGIARLPRVESIHIAVVHAERRRNENRIVNLQIGRAFAPGSVYVFRGYEFAVALHLARDCQQCFQLWRHRRAFEVRLYLAYYVVSAQVTGCSRAVAGLAKIAVVLRRNVGRNQFALTGREAVGLMQQLMGQVAHGLRCLWSKGECTADSRQTFGKCDMCHSSPSALHRLSRKIVLLTLKYPSRATILPRSRYMASSRGCTVASPST